MLLWSTEAEAGGGNDEPEASVTATYVADRAEEAEEEDKEEDEEDGSGATLFCSNGGMANDAKPSVEEDPPEEWFGPAQLGFGGAVNLTSIDDLDFAVRLHGVPVNTISQCFQVSKDAILIKLYRGIVRSEESLGKSEDGVAALNSNGKKKLARSVFNFKVCSTKWASETARASL